MITRFIIQFAQPIRAGEHLIQNIGPFNTIQDAAEYYRKFLDRTHPDMKESVLAASIESIHAPT
jgi:hypothetical protein